MWDFGINCITFYFLEFMVSEICSKILVYALPYNIISNVGTSCYISISKNI